MAWPKPTIEDFRLKTEGTGLCWIEGCEESQRQRGLCKRHYDKARNNGFLVEVGALIDARSEPKGAILATMPLPPGERAVLEAPPSKYTSPQAEIAELTVQLLEAQEELSEVRAALVAAIGESDDKTPLLEKVAALVMQRDHCARIAEEAQKSLQHAHREAGAEAELRALREALAEAVGAHPEPLTPLQQVALLKERVSRGDCRDSKYLCAFLDTLEVRYDDPRPPDEEGLTQMAWTVLQNWVRRHAAAELSNALGSVRRLADELAAVDQALGPYLRQVAGDRGAAIRFVRCRADQLTDVDQALDSIGLLVTHGRIAAIEALATPTGPVLLSEEGLRERFSRLNEIGHAEDLLKGLSEPLQGSLRAVLEAEKAKVLRVCP